MLTSTYKGHFDAQVTICLGPNKKKEEEKIERR